MAKSLGQIYVNNITIPVPCFIVALKRETYRFSVAMVAGCLYLNVPYRVLAAKIK